MRPKFGSPVPCALIASTKNAKTRLTDAVHLATEHSMNISFLQGSTAVISYLWDFSVNQGWQACGKMESSDPV